MIGIFDSGVGGLYIYERLKKELPRHGFVYLADQAFAPYGFRAQEEIIQRSAKIVRYFYSLGCKAVIVACNTATVNAIEALRQEFDLPILGIEPAIKPALANHDNILVLATHSTVKNKRYHELVDRYNNGKQVYHIGATELVYQVERGDLLSLDILKSKIGPLQDSASAIVIGCTHFSYLKRLIKETWPDLDIYDGADGLVRHAKTVLGSFQAAGQDRFFSTKQHARSSLEKAFDFSLLKI